MRTPRPALDGCGSEEEKGKSPGRYRRVTSLPEAPISLKVPLQLHAELVLVRVGLRPVGHEVVLARQAELAGEVFVPADAGAAPVIARRVLVRVGDVVTEKQIAALAGVIGDLSVPAVQVR